MHAGSRTALGAITRRRFLLSAWPWRASGYLVASSFVMVCAIVALGTLSVPWTLALSLLVHGSAAQDSPVRDAVGSPVGLLSLAVLGVVVFTAGAPLVAVPLAPLERQRLALVDTRPMRSGHRPPSGPGAWPWLKTRYRESATWREVAYAVLLVTVGPVVYLAVFAVAAAALVFVLSPLLVHDGVPVAVGVGRVDSVGEGLRYALAGIVMLPAVPYLVVLVVGGHGAVTRALLGGGDEQRLRAELVEVSRSRARLVDAFETERRRIERDLHDGAQERLVGLTLRLGIARLDIPPESPAYEHVSGAHDQAKQLMAELREFIRGIHPRVLADRGLPAALSELADRSAVPVTVRADLTDRPPRHLETTAYFVATEALANIAKHSRATAASVTVWWEGENLVMEVLDDGRGGADPDGGTGLTGLADRVAVLDGRMFLSSPPGGPTLLRVELPCIENDPRSE